MKQADKPILHKNSVLALVFSIVLALIALASFKVGNPHPHSWLEEHLPCFWSLFAFGAAAIIICLSRWLARAGLEWNKAIYDEPIAPAEEDRV